MEDGLYLNYSLLPITPCDLYPIVRWVFVRDAPAEMVTSSTILEVRFLSHVILLKLDDRDAGRLKLV